MDKIIQWKEGVVWSHIWFRTCPRCSSLETEIVSTRHPHNGIETVRRCHMCNYEWKTGVYGGDDYGDDDYNTEGELPLD